jgi:hypothetical protein
MPHQTTRRGAVRGMPAVMPPVARPVVQTATRDQFGGIVLRQVGGQR